MDALACSTSERFRQIDGTFSSAAANPTPLTSESRPMDRSWHSLSSTDPALNLHALLHDTIDQWVVEARLGNPGLYAISPSLHLGNKRACSTAISIKMGVMGALDEIIKKAGEQEVFGKRNK